MDSGRLLQRISTAVIALWLLIGGVDAGRADQTLHLTTGNDYKPFSDESLPAGGLAAEIVAEVYHSMGVETSIDVLPWNRSYELAARGEYAATFPYVETEQREKDFIYSDPIYVLETKAMALADTDWNAASLEDLEGRAYCRPLAYAIENTEEMHRMTKEERLTWHKPANMTKCVEMLDLGRVDFVLVSEPQGVHTAREVLGSSDRVRFLDVSFDRHSLHVLFPRRRADSAEAVHSFNVGLLRLKASGRYDDIVSRHLE